MSADDFDKIFASQWLYKEGREFRIRAAPKVRRPPKPVLRRMSARSRASTTRAKRSVIYTLAAAGSRRQRVTVKAKYVRHRGAPNADRGSKLRAHLDYLARESATQESGRAVFFDAQSDGLAAQDLASAWGHDRHHWRIILSPEYGGALPDWRGYVRRFMQRFEHAAETRLDWRGVVHWNTDNPHAHVVVRGVREDGADLVLPRDMIMHQLRRFAEQEATAWLGPRDLMELEEQLHRDAEALRPVGLDRVIAETQNGRFELDVGPKWDHPHARREHVWARLATLESLGLAERPHPWLAPVRWRVAKEFRRHLSDLAERQRLPVNVAGRLAERKENAYWHRPSDGLDDVGEVVAAGPLESGPFGWVGIDDRQGGVRLHRVESRTVHGLREGDLIEITYADGDARSSGVQGRTAARVRVMQRSRGAGQDDRSLGR